MPTREPRTYDWRSLCITQPSAQAALCRPQTLYSVLGLCPGPSTRHSVSEGRSWSRFEGCHSGLESRVRPCFPFEEACPCLVIPSLHMHGPR